MALEGVGLLQAPQKGGGGPESCPKVLADIHAYSLRNLPLLIFPGYFKRGGGLTWMGGSSPLSLTPLLVIGLRAEPLSALRSSE